MHIPEYNPTFKLHLRTLHREACTGRFTWYMSCTFQTWNSTKNNSFHQELDSLITYLRWLDQFTYLTPRWHQVIFIEFSFVELCHLQIRSAKSKTMLRNQQTRRQEMFPDKVFPSHTVSQIFLAMLRLSISSALTTEPELGAHHLSPLFRSVSAMLQILTGTVSIYLQCLAHPSRAELQLTWTKFQ